MGLKLSCSRDDRPTNPKRSYKNERGNESLTECNGWLCGARAPTTKTKKKTEQFHIHQHENHDEEDMELHKSKNKKVLTLEDWILSSPSLPSQVIMGKASSRKIHPSFDAKTTESFSVKEEETGFGNSSSGRKLKKKVSFRSPEVADVFVLDISPDHANMTRTRRGITA